MKIAFIGQKGIPARFGGVETHVEALATRLVARGHQVEAYVRNWYTPLDLARHDGVALRHLPTIRTKHLDATLHSGLASIDSCFRKRDVLHYQATGPGSFAFIPRACGQKVVLTFHSLDWQRTKWSLLARVALKVGEVAAVRSASRIITVSPELERYVAQRHRRKATYITNGVDLPPPVHPTGFLEEHDLLPGRYILFMGRFVPEKRVDWLIESFGELVRAGHDGVKLVLAGGAEQAEKYSREIRKKAQSLPCRLPGYVEGEDKTELLRSAMLVVLPSSLEGLPIFLLEAMAHGVPCLASDIEPHCLLLSEGRGMLFARDDRHDLSKKLKEAVNLPPERLKEMAEKSREYVEHRHDWDRITEATEKIYASLVTRQGYSP